MLIWVDSREKWTQSGNTDQHIPKWFQNHGVEWEVRKLDTGDYRLPGGGVVIDRKASLDELATNLLNRADKSRFWKEVRRAREEKLKLIILCEHGHGVEKLADVKTWRSRYSPVTGSALSGEIYRVNIAYGVEFFFCCRRNAAKRIIEILTEEPNETG